MVQARVTERLIAGCQIILIEHFRTTKALGDIVARELNVDTTRECAHSTMGLEEPLNFIHDVVKSDGLWKKFGV